MTDTLTPIKEKHIILRAPGFIMEHERKKWKPVLAGLMLEWRWGDHTTHLIDTLEAMDRKVSPALYDAETATESVSAILKAIPADHNAILLSYSDDKGLTITTCQEKKPGHEIECRMSPSSHIEYAFNRLTPPKKGKFTINDERWKAAGMGSTDISMYECDECKEAGKEHNIIEIPGPPARNTEVCLTGEPTHYHQCTNCKAVDGPWVPA